MPVVFIPLVPNRAHDDLGSEDFEVNDGACPGARVECRLCGDEFVCIAVAEACAPPMLELAFETDVRCIGHEMRV